jgi:hypothetical protein
MSTRVQIVNRVKETSAKAGEWQLELQWCRYCHDDGEMEHGYRFIWLRPDGSLQAARGQARIPSLSRANALIQKATSEGWGDYDGDLIDRS